MNSMNFSRAGKFNKPGNFKKKKDLKSHGKKTRIYHIVCFVNRPHFYQHVAFGKRVIK